MDQLIIQINTQGRVWVDFNIKKTTAVPDFFLYNAYGDQLSSSMKIWSKGGKQVLCDRFFIQRQGQKFTNQYVSFRRKKSISKIMYIILILT